MRPARLAVLLLALAALPAIAQPPARHFDREERMRLRDDVRRDDAAAEARRREYWRLRDEVKSGRMSREEAVRSYHERFGERRGHWRSPEEREQMRRDIQEANRSLEPRGRR